MKEKSINHSGNMPTKVLQHNITHRFETVRHETKEMQINDVVRNGKISREIIVLIDKVPISSPYANCESLRICLNEPFIAFLWVTVYYFFNIQEHIMARQLADNWDGEIDLSNPIFARATRLFEWSLSLRHTFSEWDSCLPNPDFDNSELLAEEKDIALKVNNLFLDAISYVMFHEYAHIVNEHCTAHKALKTKKNLKSDDIALLIQFEKEADTFAFEALVKEYDQENQRKLKGIAILLAHVAMLFIVKDPNALVQERHPDVDTRLFGIVEKLQLEDNRADYYLKSLLGIACNTFFNYHRVELEMREYDTVDEQIHDYLTVFDDLKT